MLCSFPDCGILLQPANGEVVVSGTHLGDQALYRCDTGYSLQGTNTLVCQIAGWSHDPPTCVVTGLLK